MALDVNMMVAAALSPWVAKTKIGASQLMEIARHACTCHDALAAIRKACEAARDQGGALNPESLLAFLADNNLILTETNHGQSEPDAA